MLSDLSDSIGTKLGGKPGGKKLFKAYNTDKKNHPGKSSERKMINKFSKVDKFTRKRKVPHGKVTEEQEENRGENM